MNDNLLLPDSRPTRSDAVQNRALLLKTAQQLFDQHGVDTVSMTAIAQEAGVGKGTLYRHFESKMALCLALLDENQRELQERTLSHFRANPDAYENLRWFLEQTLDYLEKNGEFLSMAGYGGGYFEDRAHLWWRQTIYQMLLRLKPAGDVEYMADTLYVMLEAHVYQYMRQRYDSDRLRDGLQFTLDQFLK